MKNVPAEIYLIIEDTDSDNFHESGDVLWCIDSINDRDIKYIRAQPNATGVKKELRITELEQQLEAALKDAERYRFIRSEMHVGCVQTMLPLYRSLHWVGYEECRSVADADDAIDAAITSSKTEEKP